MSCNSSKGKHYTRVVLMTGSDVKVGLVASQLRGRLYVVERIGLWTVFDEAFVVFCRVHHEEEYRYVLLQLPGMHVLT